MASAQNPDLQSTFPLGNDPVKIQTQQRTYTNCSYIQESNAFENGYVSNTMFPRVSADDFTIPAGECWNIEGITANFLTNNPTDASAMNIYIYADAGGDPGTVLNTYIASPADWSNTIIGYSSNSNHDGHKFEINLPTSINLCGGATGTTYWFSIQAVNSITDTDFYWESLNAVNTGYGNNARYATSTAGPWGTNLNRDFVFELKRKIVNNLTMTECEGFSFTVGTNTYNTSGVTQDVLLSVNGCDSIVNLDLTILPNSTGTDTRVSCNAITWIDGNTYNTSNTTATHNIVAGAANGCDSLVTLDLTIISSSVGTDIQVACPPFIWIDGNSYSVNNMTATHTIAGGSAAGCDSIVTLNLTILTPPNDAITLSNATLTATEVGATYQWVDCDNANIGITGETNQDFTPNTTGNYAVDITLNGCAVTSACALVDYTAIKEYSEFLVSVYPNPTSSEITILVNNSSFTYQVMNILGELVMINTASESETVDLSKLSNGVYFVKVTVGNFEEIIKVVKK